MVAQGFNREPSAQLAVPPSGHLEPQKYGLQHMSGGTVSVQGQAPRPPLSRRPHEQARYSPMVRILRDSLVEKGLQEVGNGLCDNFTWGRRVTDKLESGASSPVNG